MGKENWDEKRTFIAPSLHVGGSLEGDGETTIC